MSLGPLFGVSKVPKSPPKEPILGGKIRSFLHAFLTKKGGQNAPIFPPKIGSFGGDLGIFDTPKSGPKKQKVEVERLSK